MNVSVYLPEEIARRAREEGINVSRLLRETLIAELERRETVKATLTDPQEFKINLENADGEPYIGRFTGAQLVDDENIEVYQRTDGQVLVYDCNRLTYWESHDPEEDLRNEQFDSDESYATVMRALGITPEVDI